MDTAIAQEPMLADVSENNIALSQTSSLLSDGDLDRIITGSRPKSTDRSTKWGLNKFEEWIRKRGMSCDLHTVPAIELNGVLRKFYGEVRSIKKQPLTPSAMTGIRAALQRAITSPPYNRNINIIGDKEFTLANKMFLAKCKLYVQSGNKKPQHKPSIGPGDMQKLSAYFGNWKQHPDTLLEATWFMLCFHFGRRGREGWTKMKKDTFQVSTDDEGLKFVSMIVTESTKNHQGGFKQCDTDYSDCRMYGQGVEIYEFYLTKLHHRCERLFQTSLKVFTATDPIWFKNEPMGKTPLSSIMQTISKKSGLSVIYTCHSVRASTITALFQAGVSPQGIMAITKHKNESSLKHYISDMSSEQKRHCSATLSNAMAIQVV